MWPVEPLTAVTGGQDPANRACECGGLGAVVEHRAGAVRVDVRHVARVNAGVGQGQRHAAEGTRAVRARRHEVVGVGGGGVPEDEPERLGPDAATSSSRWSTTNPAPSPMTNPSRSASKGREASSGQFTLRLIASSRMKQHIAP